jgi:signal peptidase I
LGSLLILAGLIVVTFLLTAWVLARAARWAGSTRGRFKFGALATVAIQLAALIYLAIWALLRNFSPVLEFAWSLAGFVGLLLLIFVILRLVFRLNRRRVFIIFAVYIGIGVLLALFQSYVIKPHWTEAFRVPASTMAPTIVPGDRFLVNKLLRPKRWDIVVYRDTIDPNSGPPALCERLVGLPGERIRFIGGDLYVNDQLVNAPEVISGNMRASDTGFAHYPWKYAESQPITLGDDECFLIGDNVAISMDSRILGPRPISSIIGVVDAMYWPPIRAKIIR